MRYLITFSYDGSNFNGYQKQKNGRTVQEEIEKALSKINNSKTSFTASGRTDAKVHAINQKGHFDFDKEIDINKLRKALNSIIPKDIYIKDIKKVSSSFHARYNVKSKVYIYKINIGNYDPINRNYIYQYCKLLDIGKMKEAINYFKGEHNFRSFTKVEIEKNFNREIFNASISLKQNIITVSFKGNGFLRFMVRNMVGLLIEIGSNKKGINVVNMILDAKDRTKAGIIAPPEGLYLKDVFY